jgi:uncharacterized protein YgiM (DUF1202 family)
MAALSDKYKSLIDAAKIAGVSNLQVREQNNVLYVNGETNSGSVKDQLWNVYNTIDPDYRAGDLVLDVNVAAGSGSQARVTTKESNLNIRKGPGTDQPIVGKAAKDESVTVLSQTNDQWWLVRTAGGEEGYAHASYLELN